MTDKFDIVCKDRLYVSKFMNAVRYCVERERLNYKNKWQSNKTVIFLYDLDKKNVIEEKENYQEKENQVTLGILRIKDIPMIGDVDIKAIMQMSVSELSQKK